MTRSRLGQIAAVVTVICAALPAAAQHPGDTIFIVPGSHLDIGFTAPISVVRDRRITIIDRAMDLAARDPSFVWFEEGGWSVDAWLDHYHNDAARIARLRALVMQGRFGVGATLLSPHGAAFPGALHLLTLHLDRIEHELGKRPTVAVINDVPAVPEAMIDMLAAAGIHYLLMGPNLVFSSPLPASVTKDPFYWQSARGSRVLVAIDPQGYGAGVTQWLLPPACARAMSNGRIPAAIPDDTILAYGPRREIALRSGTQPLGVVQHSMDNGDPDCAAMLPATARSWNARGNATRLVVALPEIFFQHLEARRRATIATRKGEWGGDWDLLRASEPVWSWRLRTAIAAITPATPRNIAMAAAMATDHNVGLGPRWLDGMPQAEAAAHIREVAELYRTVVSGALGAAALQSIPPPLTMPAGRALDPSWQAMFADPAHVATVRAGVSFIYPFIPANAVTIATPMQAGADAERLVVHTVLDRTAIEHSVGPRYQAVIDFRLKGARSSMRIAPANSPSARSGIWLLGTPAERIVAPGGVVVDGPGWSVTARGPLIVGWTLVADAANPLVTHLQALALVHAVDGVVDGGRRMQLPFAQMYPGEPAMPAFDIELMRLPPHR